MTGGPPGEIAVHRQDVDGVVRVGTAYPTTKRGITTTRFEYAADYLRDPDAWSISTDLPVGSGGGSTSGLPGALADSAPDRWGQNLVRKRLRAEAAAAGRAERTVTEVDFLLGVSDLTRQGALRYTVGDDPSFRATGSEVPKLVELPGLLHAACEVGREDDHEAIKVLLDAGSASLGGARPKASVRDGDRLFIAKFPHDGDDWNVMAWEKTALDLAAAAGIAVPERDLVRIGDGPVLLVQRFDRNGAERISYLSAMSLVGTADGAAADYLEVAEAITDHGDDVRAELRRLWRRIAFSIAVNNTDDHLRNHGFLRAPSGWTLSPMFDVNPNPDPGARRVTTIGGVDGPTATLDALVDVAAWFELTADDAHAVWAEVRAAVDDWRAAATANGIGDAEQRRFAPVLDRR